MAGRTGAANGQRHIRQAGSLVLISGLVKRRFVRDCSSLGDYLNMTMIIDEDVSPQSTSALLDGGGISGTVAQVRRASIVRSPRDVGIQIVSQISTFGGRGSFSSCCNK